MEKVVAQMALGNEDEDDDEYESGRGTLPNLVFVLGLLLVLDILIFEMASRKNLALFSIHSRSWA